MTDLKEKVRSSETAGAAHVDQRDENWPEWYAAFMAAEQAGGELPL